MNHFHSFLLILFIGIGGTLAEDFLEHLLRSHHLHEIPQLSKLNMGSDNIYIGRNRKNEPEFMMSFQKYAGGGPHGQSEIFNIEMTGEGPVAKPSRVKGAISEEEPEEKGHAASEEPEE